MTNLAEGVLRQHWVKEQSTFDTLAAFVAGDGVKLIEMKLEPSKTYEDLKEACGTASLQGEAAAGRGGQWSAVAHLRPNALGVAPDAGPFFKAGYGVETISGGVSVTYALTDTVAPVGLQMAQKTGSYLWEVASGAWVEQVMIEGQAQQTPRVTFSGGFARYAYVYGSTIASGSGTSITMTAAHAGNVGVGAVVKFGTEDNGGSGYTVTAVSADGVTLTITPTLAGAVSGGDEVAPVIASPTTSGTLIEGGQDALTLDAIAVGTTGYKYTLDTGVRGLSGETDTDRVNRLARGERRVSAELGFYFLDRESGPVAGMAWNGLERALIHRIGPSTAAAKATWNIPKWQPQVSAISVPEADEATFTGSGKGHQSAAAADEHTLVFD